MATASTADPGTAGKSGDYGTDGSLPRLSELLTAAQHSRDFTATRSEYIGSRLVAVQLLFAIGFLAWIPVDYLMLAGKGEATALLGARIGLAVLLAGLYVATRRSQAYRTVMLVLATTLIAVAIFYVASMIILEDRVGSDLIGGYRALPFVLIVLTALFPVTVAFGTGLIAAILALNVGVEAYIGQLTSVASINTLWMLTLVGAVAVWVQAGQLAMQLRLYRESARDPVTGLVARQVFRRVLDRELRRTREEGEPVSLVSVVLTGFDNIRREYGQFAADAALARTAAELRRLPGNEELKGRYEGEMLVVGLVGYDAVQAMVEAEHLRNRIERSHVATPGGEKLPLEASVTVTQFGADDGLDRVMDRIGRSRPSGNRRQVSRA